MNVMGIDPGLSGAIVVTDGVRLQTWEMPVIKIGKDRSISYLGLFELFRDIRKLNPRIPVFLERAIPMAQGSKAAFNYGRGFEAIVIALETLKLSTTYVEPSRWSKVLHEGISSDLKPKAKSLIAVRRLFPHLVKHLPTNSKGALHDGPIDALLIAAYGLRTRGGLASSDTPDFF